MQIITIIKHVITFGAVDNVTTTVRIAGKLVGCVKVSELITFDYISRRRRQFLLKIMKLGLLSL